jgi:hypothetical protein
MKIKSTGGIMFRKSIAVVATIVLSAGVATMSASAATPKVAVKAGGACSKVGSLTTINHLKYVCVKNSRTHKLTWVKKAVPKKIVLSAECLSMQKANVKMQSDYDSALAQVADTQAKIATLSGPSGDSLRAQVAQIKSTILILGPTVADGKAQFKLFCG